MKNKETTMTIRWKDGSRIGCSAEAAYRFFERIRADNDGDLDLADAVHKSKPKNAPLHNELEWNNAKCGDLWRRDQMRRVARRLEVIRTDMPATRVYESVKVDVVNLEKPETVPAQTRNVFRRTEDILSDPNTRDQLLMQAVRDALAFKRRYAALSELAKVIHVIDEVTETLKAKLSDSV